MSKRSALPEVRPETLGSTESLLNWVSECVRRGLLEGSEAERFRVFAAAAHAQRVGRDPAALFAWTIRGRDWDKITVGDEDSARRRLERWLDPTSLNPHKRARIASKRFGGTRAPAAPVTHDSDGENASRGHAEPSADPENPDDATVAAAWLATCNRNGVRDPAAAIARVRPDWTPQRYRRAIETVARCRDSRLREFAGV